ncbi:uncharacterized protein LOC129228322 [Uloborus diversus]|uniref:uncharacterized protein LOC129228322 n=1 Tax=Uloborus diversus TaxID=327109 RepID=UPI0024096657|nr:uncharacterized protein LOC129228322 [Uloborus diversus]
MTRTLKEVNRYAGVVNLDFGRKEKRAVEDLDHDCAGNNFWRQKCCYIEIDVLFDRFVIKNLTYNAKFESLELFSVIGGYLGMWLGVSLLNTYDILELVRSFITDTKKKLRTEKVKKKNDHRSNDFVLHRNRFIGGNDIERISTAVPELWTSYM